MASGRKVRDADGVTFAAGAQRWRKHAWLAAACALGLAAAWFACVPRGGSLGAAPRAGDAAAAAPDPEPQREPSASMHADERDPATRAAGEPGEIAASGVPQQLEEPDTLPEGVVPSGIGLFPPPGTDPVKIGIVVPEDFPLPEGYLRHYQVTDDGQDMPAILMFHPDYELLDERGAPLPLPADLVVPPELAPEGLPIELLEPPAPRAEEGAP